VVDEIVDIIDKVDEVSRLLMAASALVGRDTLSPDEGLLAVVGVAYDKVKEISGDLKTVVDAIPA
jgi:hypothetical protein